ncbi:taste receptor type 1 member 1 isoform X2 [Phacochoerus africanus]|uniref:taste receptor type 1 member 1 isoform X2 n=1 Tax=Phacochoerus africanus TaxID=41426 RepID=UPI001FD8A66A|nr:taste receptor type 1 member 1 isoform X2 [Phacochoerus africanus]
MLLWEACLLGLQLSLSCCWTLGCQGPESSPDFSLPGDYLVAGLFPLHGDHPEARRRPTVAFCDRPNTFNGHGYHLFQAMRFGIEEINNSSTLLPNVTLGYELYDVCSESANVYATLSILSKAGTGYVDIQENPALYSPKTVAVIGPDTTSRAATTAGLLGPFLVPLVSYDASSMVLGVKRVYPSFLRTIPSDDHQVEVLVLLLRRFRWDWISVVGSEGDYGQLGVQALEGQARRQGICIAFKDIVPFSAQPGDQRMQSMMGSLALARTTVVVVFSGRQLARVFFESVVLANLTSKVWVASEDWAISRHISSVPGIRGIGTVLGVAIPGRLVPGLKEFEEAYVRAEKGALGPCPRGSRCSTNQLCTDCWAFTAQEMPTLGAFSMSSAYNVYQAVYAVAQGLHQLLGCASGICSRGQVYPWQVPTSVCSSDCPEGHQRVIMSFHHCCFECVPCEAGTFLNKSDPYSCRPCGKEEWAPERSQTCFPRTVVFLTWHEPISCVLLAANTMLLLLVAGTAGLFAWYLDTPVVRSAGGRMCFLMLGSLAGGSCGLYGFFGEPMLPTCLLRQGLFALGFAIFLSCLTIRSFQLVFIFKFSAKMPTFFHAWVQNHGAGLFVVISSITQLLICLVWLAVWTPLPTREYQRFPQLVVLDCTEANSLGLRLAFTYNGLLLVSAFACSYLGKDLPENYNEAKCVTFSLLLNFVSWITFFTVASVYQGKYLAAVNVFAMLSSLSGGFSGYFLPKCYIILCRPDLNSTEHFQASIQDYSRCCGST